jgi:allantoin racemase
MTQIQQAKQKIMVIIPIAADSAEAFMPGFETEINAAISSDFEVTYKSLPGQATPFIQSRTAEFWDTFGIIEIAQQAQKEGFNGIFVNCFGEPGVEVLKEIVDIPVVGGFYPAIANAMMVSSRFSIVTVLPSVVPMLWTLARQMGVTSSIASVREVGLSVNQLEDTDLLKQKLLEQSIIAIEQDGAEAILLGCTGMLEVNQWLANELETYFNGQYVPVVAPVGSAIGALQNLIKNNLSASRLAYYKPVEFEGITPSTPY